MKKCGFYDPKKSVIAWKKNGKIRFFPGERDGVLLWINTFMHKGISRNALTHLLGAVEDSEIFLGTLHGRLYAEHYELNRLGLVGCVRISRSSTGSLRLFQELRILKAEMRSQGEGTRIFQRQKESCRKIGVDQIIMFGRRSPLEWGYYVLPRFGFEGFVSEDVCSKIPRRMESGRKIQDLFKSEQDRIWWKTHGTTIPFPLVLQLDKTDILPKKDE